MANDIADTQHTSLDAPTTNGKTTNYWFDDGSVIARLRNRSFKVHKGLLDRHSSYIASLPTQANGGDVPVVHIPEERASSADFETLLEYLYHDLPSDANPSFSHIASLLRISSEKQLHYPSIHARVKSRFQEMFPASAAHFVHPEYPEEALKLAIEHDIHEAQKPLYYSVATTLHFDSEEASPESISSILPKDVTARCASLQNSLIEYFTPILFTVATASHMACTDIFAEMWMPLVLAPAIETSGLCTPVETLRKIQQIKWEEHGLCAECCQEKRAEWEDEARSIWDKVDGWLGLPVEGASKN